MASTYEIPKTMKAIRYNALRDFSLVEDFPVPDLKPHEVLVKVVSCGVCGTDLHIHDGDFESKMPVITGHETSGIIVRMGSEVRGLSLGDKVTGDNSELCLTCHYCRQGKFLYCEDFKGHGVHLDGGFAEYTKFPAEKVHKFEKLSWTDAAVFEAASCAVHSLDRIRPDVGCTALVIGSGATGLCLAQLLRLNGARHLVLASNKGSKMDLAKTLDCADEYLELDRANPEPQWEDLKKRNPYGFDIVVEASGSHHVLEKSIDYCARGGKLVYFGVYEKEALIKVSPSRVFGDELTLIGSFSMMYCMPRAVAYLESGAIKVGGIVDATFRIEQFGEALDAIRQKKCVKAAIMFD